MRHGYNYLFNDTYNNANNYSHELETVDWYFQEEYDYNNSSSFPTFGLVDPNWNWLFPANDSLLFLESTSSYPIYSYPPSAADQSYDNFVVAFDLMVHGNLANGQQTPSRNHTECKYYEISRCGDGILDTDYDEACDDGNTIDGDGCESDCTLTPSTAGECASTYDGQTIYDFDSNGNALTQNTP